VTLWWPALQATPIQLQKDVAVDQLFAKMLPGSNVMCFFKDMSANSSVVLVWGIAKQTIKQLISNRNATTQLMMMMMLCLAMTVGVFQAVGR
jgi:hypothetical protein